MMHSNKVTVGMDGALYAGKPCDITKVSRGWTGIVDYNGRAKMVRATEITLVPSFVPDDKPARKAPATPLVTIPGIETKTEGNTMKVTRKPKGDVRKLGDSEFKRFKDYERTKTASGNVSFDSGDEVATKLRGMSLDELFEFAAKKLDTSVRSLKDKYGRLNAGLARMSIGNRLRGAATVKG